jgi:hypothetical protein
MSDVHIERLRLRASGLDEDAARHLARLVAERLAAGEFPVTGSPAIASLLVEVKPGAKPGQKDDHDDLATRIVEEIRRELAL